MRLPQCTAVSIILRDISNLQLHNFICIPIKSIRITVTDVIENSACSFYRSKLVSYFITPCICEIRGLSRMYISIVPDYGVFCHAVSN